MITLGIILYIITSLIIAFKEYNEGYIFTGVGYQESVFYKDIKLSLIYGFTLLPALLIILLLGLSMLIVGVWGIVEMTIWIVQNLP